MSQMPLVRPEITSGTLIDSRYIIQKLLGQGGLGRTYLAFDTRRFNEACVLKEFAPIGTGHNELEKCRNLFKREAKILHQLQHRQIPEFLACFEGDGRLFLVQEYVDGKTYSKLLRERQNLGRAFSEQEVIQWLNNLLPVLEYIHRNNIIHRDISPDNIMLPDGSDVPVLIDFGVGKQIAELHNTNTTNSQQPTYVGKMSLVGKVGYAPREQISLGLCSPSSDLYALGVTAAVLLTGRDPCLLMDQYSLEWRWRLYTNVSDAFAQILDRMLADTPNKRFQNTQEVVANLQRVQSQVMLPSTEVNLPPTEITPPPNSTTFRQSYNQFAPPSGNFTAKQHPHQQQYSQQQYSQQYSQQQYSQQQYSQQQYSQQQSSQQKSSLDPAFVKRCQQELAYNIGPMASFIVEEILSENPQISSYQFVELMAREISDSQAALEFTRRLFS